jgi:hypothetical protein
LGAVSRLALLYAFGRFRDETHPDFRAISIDFMVAFD